jgi:serine protease Do
MLLMDLWRKYRKTVVAMSVAGAVLAAGCGGVLADNTSQGTIPETSRPAASTGALSDARNTPAVRVAKSVGPAVVGITNRAVARDWFNHQFEYEQGVGSGVIFREDGYIVTNNHVVAGAREIMVSLSDGRSVKGKLVGADELTDIAIVKIDGDGFPTAAFGNSDDIVVGEPAIAIGNPMGLEFQGSVTVGVISALNRTLDISERHLKLIQTDAAISPGNSGGALANADGLVIGINSAKIAANGVEGMGFAIPINAVRDIVDQIMDHGRVIRPYLGVGVYDKETAARAGYQLNVDAGVYVQNVTLNGPAGKAGIQRGDVILSVGGEKTNTVGELRAAITGHQVGDSVEVVFMRGNDKITVTAVLEAIPEE